MAGNVKWYRLEGCSTSLRDPHLTLSVFAPFATYSLYSLVFYLSSLYIPLISPHIPSVSPLEVLPAPHRAVRGGDRVPGRVGAPERERGDPVHLRAVGTEPKEEPHR